MERRNAPEIPYIVFEGEMSRQERQIKRLWVALIVAIVALAVTVGSFIWYLNQYDFESYEQDGSGVNIIGDGNGVVDYVAASTAEGQEEPQFREG